MKSLIWWSVTWRPGKRRLLAGETAIPHDRPAAITRQRAPPGDTPTLTLIDALLSPRSSRYNPLTGTATSAGKQGWLRPAYQHRGGHRWPVPRSETFPR